jgi:O-6-methylguanine DNA methyltransferase
MEPVFFFRTPSPVGPLFLAASAKGLLRLEFEGRGQKFDSASIELRESKQTLAPYLRELDEYFAGERRQFTIPLDLRGTPFQLACWQALLAIPYGETRSYADIARAIGHAQAFRAVGMSNNRNPVAIIVPCHRVIASSGSSANYWIWSKTRFIGVFRSKSGHNPHNCGESRCLGSKTGSLS